MALVTIPEIQVLDPYYAGVVLLVPANGLDGSTSFVDASISKKPIAANGNASIRTAQSKFGGSSMHASGGGYLAIPASPDFNFGTGDFTIEFFRYLLSQGGNGYNHYFSIGDQATFAVKSWASATYLYANGATVIAAAATILNQQQHVAITRSAGVMRLFIEGVLVATVAYASNLGSSTMGARVGGVSDLTAEYLDGYLDDFRITKGVARYTADFTPPTAEAPWVDTSLLGARSLTTPIARRVCAPPRALLPGGPVTAAFDNKLAQRNIYHGGTGQIAGTVKEKNLPVNVPLHRRVCLLEEKTRLLVAETWSDATTGNYLFERIDPSRTYTVLAYDYTGLYRAVIADRLVPEMLP